MLHEKLNHRKAAWRTLLWSAENGDAECAYWVGKYYWIGKNTNKSLNNAIKYFMIAAEQGVCEANITLSLIHKDNQTASSTYLKYAKNSVNNDIIIETLKKEIERWL